MSQADLYMTIVSLHEQFLGWNAYIARAKDQAEGKKVSKANGTVDLKSIGAAILRREKTMGAGGYLVECEPGM